MRVKKILLLMAVAVLSGTLFSCTKETPYEKPNPLPGTWVANNVDYNGFPVNFEAVIADKFESDADIYSLEGGDTGSTMNGYADGELYETGLILGCIFNARTDTGQFVILYDDDPVELAQEVVFYYDRRKDTFTVIQPNYSITFSRKK